MEHGIEILEAEYYSIKEKLRKANEEMIENPNEYSNNLINYFTPKLKQLRECLRKLEQTENQLT